jgi:hypothetical protein
MRWRRVFVVHFLDCAEESLFEAFVSGQVLSQVLVPDLDIFGVFSHDGGYLGPVALTGITG